MSSVLQFDKIRTNFFQGHDWQHAEPQLLVSFAIMLSHRLAGQPQLPQLCFYGAPELIMTEEEAVDWVSKSKIEGN